MNKETLLADLDASTKKISEALSQFDATNFNSRPLDGGWPAAQVAEHLLMLEISANKALSGETIPTNREPDKKISLIKWAMDDETKRQAPERVQPTGTYTEPQQLIEKIKQQRDKLREAVTTSDVTEACISFKHPALGTLTKWEWVYFTIYHMQRHVKQLQRLQAYR